MRTHTFDIKKGSFIGKILLIALLVFTLSVVPINSGTTWAASTGITPPTITSVDPPSAFNDLDTTITLTGTDFASETSDNQVLTSPTVSIGSTTLTDVTWVNDTTLTARIAWGMDPGVYPITVVNPDGGTGSLENAFTVKAGIGQWNGGALFGGQVNQIMMKPGDPDTLYAAAYGIVGLFRSKDAGEHWSYINDQEAINNGWFAIDPLHPGWIYGFTNGLQRSQDEGETWTTVMPNVWPDGRSIRSAQVFVSPFDPQVLFISSSESYGDTNAGGAVGLIKSTDDGVSWHIVDDMDGLMPQSISFHPTDPLQMVLATSDGRVFQSTDAGDHWSEVTKPSITTLGWGGRIAYNPFNPDEVWVAAAQPGAIYKSTDAAFTGWVNVSPSAGVGSRDIKFTSADSVYITHYHSTDGGQHWQSFGQITSEGEVQFDPANSQIAYLGDYTYGILKTNDGGQTWMVKNQGLTGMICNSLDVSQVDPLRLYATFGDSLGIYRSTDGASNWTYLPIPDSIHVGMVSEDPFDPQRIYVESHSNFYVSTNGGEGWSDLGWNASPPAPPMGWLLRFAVDPYQAGHLLTSIVVGSYGIGTGLLYSSIDYGVSWQAVTLPQQVAWISPIVFDPETPGLVYFGTGGTGIYRSTDSGENWARIDDPDKQDMRNSGSISIATHPQHVLLIGSSPNPYRSLDNGDTWTMAQRLPIGPTGFIFAGGDSNRLYLASSIGLFFSMDTGDTWTRAAGVLGQVQILALGFGSAVDHTILYAATPGGSPGTASSAVGGTYQPSLAAGSNPVDAGIYRYVQRIRYTFLPVVQR